jgi:hypothetical protein
VRIEEYDKEVGSRKFQPSKRDAGSLKHSSSRWEAANSLIKEWDCEKRNHSSHIDSKRELRRGTS